MTLDWLMLPPIGPFSGCKKVSMMCLRCSGSDAVVVNGWGDVVITGQMKRTGEKRQNSGMGGGVVGSQCVLP